MFIWQLLQSSSDTSSVSLALPTHRLCLSPPTLEPPPLSASVSSATFWDHHSLQCPGGITLESSFVKLLLWLRTSYKIKLKLYLIFKAFFQLCSNLLLQNLGTSVVVQWIRLHRPVQEVLGSTPGQGAKTPHASSPKPQTINPKQYYNKFNRDFKMVHIKNHLKKE